MSTLLQVIIFSFIGGVLSLIGGFTLILVKHKKSARIADYATAFAAGALLSAAFVDILPEAIEEATDHHPVFWGVLIGILLFFLLEHLLHWFHHHKHHSEHSPTTATVPLVIIGDTLHNFIDGIAIAAGFLTSPSTGIVVTLAVAAHEVPQEIGDFGIMLHGGVKRSKVLLINFLSSLATTASAVIFFLVGSNIELDFTPILGLVAGFFIYIAVSDIIPTIHKDENRKLVGTKTIMLIIGAIVVAIAVESLHGFIE